MDSSSQNPSFSFLIFPELVRLYILALAFRRVWPFSPLSWNVINMFIFKILMI
jgi:hypothetical protein